MRKIISVLLAALEAFLVACGFLADYGRTAGEALAQSPFFAAAPLDLFGAAQDLTLPFNAVYRLFGGTDRAHSLVYRFGNEPTYFEWIAMKAAWTDDKEYIRELKDKIVSFPQTDNGYLWSWSTSTYWPTGQGCIHYDGLFRYVAAVSELIRWDGNAAFLNETDFTASGDDRALDASRGRSVYEKCKAAMDYAFEALDGKNGRITLTEKSVFLSDGVTRFDRNENGATVWNNTGRAGSSASNYWDNLCFGHCDAYETMLYYHALTAMRSIETMRGDPAAAAVCAKHAAFVKECFNQTFWSSETGRYIACVDADGKRWDPGLTFLNTEALAYGLGDAEKANAVFDWLDGRRIVAGDTVTGKAIPDYSRLLKNHFGKAVSLRQYRFVPVTNTVSVEDLSGDGPAWWYDLDGAICVGENGNAAYGRHLENGGYLFYTLYYELAARADYLGADSVKERAKDLAAVYRFNGFDSDVGDWMEGMTGEFPESGILTCAYVASLCGVAPSAHALVVRPKIPSGISELGIARARYGNAVFEIKTGRTSLEIKAETAFDGTLVFCPEEQGGYRVEITCADGAVETATAETDAHGAIVLTARDRPLKTLVIRKEQAGKQ
ncbi:MAG: hypothetical protein IKD72_09975 [Clostridia bacterium]|nr:hypothetical protein [Clostridia bacterium]